MYGNVDQATYKDQSARMEAEIDKASQELRAAESEFLDLEGILGFAEKIITSLIVSGGIASGPKTTATKDIIPGRDLL